MSVVAHRCPYLATRRSAAGHPVRGVVRYEHRPGHRHQPGHVCRTLTVLRAAVQKRWTVNPPMVSARCNFLYSPQGRALRAAAEGPSTSTYGMANL